MKLLLFVFILLILINYLQVEAKDKSLEKKRTKNNNIKKYLNRNSAKHPKQRSSKQAKRQKWRRKKYSERKVKNGGCVYQVVHKNHYWGLRKELSRLILDPNNKDVIETYETYIPLKFIGLERETRKYRCKLKKIY